jgi:hypothetical protein
MDRALSGDEPLLLLCLNLEFFFLQRCCKKIAHLYFIVSDVVGNPLANLFCGGQRVLATLWPIFVGILEAWQLLSKVLFARGLPISSVRLPEGIG